MLTRCAQSYLTREAIEAVRLAEFARQRSWPVGGGTLDQAKSFADFCAELWYLDRLGGRPEAPEEADDD